MNENNTASTRACMQAARRWLLWKEIQRPEKPKPDKVPYYVSGHARGATDTPEDWAQLTSYDEASATLARGGYAGLAFALGPDEYGGHWQGIDLDNVPENQLSELADALPGYVEKSPSGNGAHAIGYGAHFPALGSNVTGIEAYAHGRYFTVTGSTVRDTALVDLAPWVAQWLVPRHTRPAGAAQAESGAGSVQVDAKTVSELRSALLHMRSDAYDVWYRMGLALRELGQVGRGLWLEWSATSAKFNPQAASRKWDQLGTARSTGYQAVFAEAQRQGWVNPASNAAQAGNAPAHEGFAFKFYQPGVSNLNIEYLIDPWLPRATVIGCYGRGEAGKSSWTAQVCAAVSDRVSTLWISSEERKDHILQRHHSCGGHERTIAVLEAVPTKIDPVTKKPVATSFNVYEHMEGAILAFQKDSGAREDRPLGIVVLDAVVALVTWDKGESPNDDAGVKRLMECLFTLSEMHGITFMVLGHLNKGSGHDHMADAVTGAAAWTNSPRLSFMFAKNLESESYEGFIRTVKSNTGTKFGAIYRTVPVYTLRQRPDGHHDVLCGAVMLGPIVWGEVALREMMASEDDDRWLNNREQKRQKVQAIVDATLEALRSGPANRKVVEMKLFPEKASHRHWLAAEPLLSKQGVQVTNLERGEKCYSLPVK